MYNVISYWLKFYRKKCNLTQQEVAELLDLERSSYTYYETGKTTPDIETLMRLAKIFGVDFYDLLVGCNTSTGKYVSDVSLDDIANSFDAEEYDKFKGARYNADLAIRIRDLDINKKEELMTYLDDATKGKFKNHAVIKDEPIYVSDVEIPERELELLDKADVKNLAKNEIEDIEESEN